jgi:hypothetical protein
MVGAVAALLGLPACIRAQILWCWEHGEPVAARHWATALCEWWQGAGSVKVRLNESTLTRSIVMLSSDKVPYAGNYRVYRVSTRVSNARNQGAELIEAI